MTNMLSSEPQKITLQTADGQQLAAILYPATVPVTGNLVIAGATGVPQGFYRRFAEYARSRGFTTLTFDYRGIGLSAPRTLKGFQASFLDWAQQDLATAVNTMSNPDVPLFITGHSFGGQALGLLPNHRQVSGLYAFGTGAGWHGWMPAPERYRIWLFWNLVLPPLVRWKGYLPSKMIGIGEDLPLQVYQQWRRWCKFPHYFFDDPAMRPVTEYYEQITTPIIAATAVDDSWALPASRDAFFAGYRNAPVQKRDISRQEAQGEIGHMGYFRPDARFLWDEMLDWFRQLPVTTTDKTETASI
ncbi:alpha/beta fold hydrolase [Chromatiaceae bacterium AAb-1]|nr:alpha/beta fold hydrolase [Chromatiaceae bacterium AAb-1]